MAEYIVAIDVTRVRFPADALSLVFLFISEDFFAFKQFPPQLTKSCPPDAPRACCWTLVVGMWKCSPPQNQHRNSSPFPVVDGQVRMRREGLELTTSGLWDPRTANCAIAAQHFCIARRSRHALETRENSFLQDRWSHAGLNRGPYGY